MSPDACTLAEKRIALDMLEATREFAHKHAQRREKLSASGMGRSSGAVRVSYALARTELRERAMASWAICRRVLDADESPPDDATRESLIRLITAAVNQHSTDVDAAYQKARDGTTGTWPDLAEVRSHAIQVATSEIDIELLRRRRKQLPIGDVLRAPRYAPVQIHWRNAKAAVDSEPSDAGTALKEGMLALEALVRIVTPVNCSTLGECVKQLRAKKLVNPGIDKILDGLWTYSNSLPGVRHGGTAVVRVTDRDWSVLRPMLEAALALLLDVDLPNA
jgi:hypothetical protein